MIPFQAKTAWLVRLAHARAETERAKGRAETADLLDEMADTMAAQFRAFRTLFDHVADIGRRSRSKAMEERKQSGVPGTTGKEAEANGET
jgi:hypothetical protein